MLQKTITIILGLIIVGGLAWYIDKNYVRPSDLSESQPENLDVGGGQEGASDLFYVNLGAATEIWQMDQDGKTKKVYTDSDETFKITKLSNLAPRTSEVLAVVSKDNSGSRLVVINLNDAKQKVLKELFAPPVNLSVSPDGEWFSYTKFSNVEDQYGYTLFLEQKNGSKIEEVVNSSSEIIFPCWDNSAKTIYYGKTSLTNTEIIGYNIESQKSKTIFSTEEIVDWISLAGSDKLILSQRKIGENSAGEINSIDLDGQNLKTLVKFNGGKAAYAYLSNNQSLAYLVAQYQNKIDERTQGQIYILNAENSAKSAVRKGVQILGWRE